MATGRRGNEVENLKKSRSLVSMNVENRSGEAGRIRKVGGSEVFGVCESVPVATV